MRKGQRVSYTDKPEGELRCHIGCLALTMFGVVIVLLMLLGASMGQCASDINGTGCENEGLISFLMFPGSLILLIAVGIYASWRVTKDRE
jgi:hypothetical protein